MRRAPPVRVYPTYDRNDVMAPSYVIGTPHGTVQGWCSSEADARAIVAAYVANASTPVLHAWLNPGPDFVGVLSSPEASVRRAA